MIPFIPVDKGSHWNAMLVLIMLTAMKLLGAVSGAMYIYNIPYTKKSMLEQKQISQFSQDIRLKSTIQNQIW